LGYPTSVRDPFAAAIFSFGLALEAVRNLDSLTGINSNEPELARAIADLAQDLPTWIESEDETNSLMQT
jgi:hypothetical protein